MNLPDAAVSAVPHPQAPYDRFTERNSLISFAMSLEKLVAIVTNIGFPPSRRKQLRAPGSKGVAVAAIRLE
jgi:hypothetical protein